MDSLVFKIVKKNFIYLNILFLLIGIITYISLKNFYVEQRKELFLNNIATIIKIIKNSNSLKKIDYKDLIIVDYKLNIVKKDNFKYNEKHLVKANERGFFIYETNKYVYLYKKSFIDKKIYFFIKKEQNFFYEYFTNLSLIILLCYLVFYFLFYLNSKSIAKEISCEIEKIIKFLRNLPKQKSSEALRLNYSLEFNKLGRILFKLSKILISKDIKKQKEISKLKLTNQQKDEIISAISHEFKNPIAIISGYTQTIRKNSLDEAVKDKFLSKIDSNANKLSNLIDRLRLFLKLDNNKQPYKFTDIDICKISKELIEDLKINYKNRDIELNCKSNISIKGDSGLLSIAIKNLIENSLKYSQEKVIVNILDNRLEVIDFGIGIKDEDIDKITEKFYRVSSNGWNNSLGIGLNIVKNILKLHKFKLEIKSKINEGSSFFIIF